ncbi:MAG: hypothetical protein ACREQ5_17550, partial [Candidatus Dormibacteria bacterium]
PLNALPGFTIGSSEFNGQAGVPGSSSSTLPQINSPMNFNALSSFFNQPVNTPQTGTPTSPTGPVTNAPALNLPSLPTPNTPSQAPATPAAPTQPTLATMPSTYSAALQAYNNATGKNINVNAPWQSPNWTVGGQQSGQGLFNTWVNQNLQGGYQALPNWS